MGNECNRCGQLGTSLTMSWFNTQMICNVCDSKEQQHPQFKEAKAADVAECMKGNMNFEGIGLPNNLMPDMFGPDDVDPAGGYGLASHV